VFVSKKHHHRVGGSENFFSSSSEDNQKSILPNFGFFVFPIFAFKLGYFKVQTIFSHATNTQA
jgi:hypothetical protein